MEWQHLMDIASTREKCQESILDLPMEDAFKYRRRNSLYHQQKIQTACSILFAFFCGIMVLLDYELCWGKYRCDSNDSLVTRSCFITLTLSVGGFVAAGSGIVGSLWYRGYLLCTCIGYVLLFFIYRIVFLFALYFNSMFDITITCRKTLLILDSAVTATTGLLMWVQIYFALHFFHLLHLRNIYLTYPKRQGELICTEELANLMSSINPSHPQVRQSHIVELLSYLDPGASVFTFQQFCQMESLLVCMTKAANSPVEIITPSVAEILEDHRDSTSFFESIDNRINLWTGSWSIDLTSTGSIDLNSTDEMKESMIQQDSNVQTRHGHQMNL